MNRLRIGYQHSAGGELASGNDKNLSASGKTTRLLRLARHEDELAA